MTSFTQIYSDTHNFLQGVITIPNSATNLAKAYVETIVDGVVDNTAQPILLGFLYQVDASLRRSKPYPIVSQRQTVPLDMSECGNFLFVPVSRFIDDYNLSLYVSSESSGGTVDLSAYALISQLPDLSTYAKIADIPNLSNYVSNSQLATALSGYALISQLPNLSGYALKTDIPSSFGSNQNFIAISANQTLESNKNYFANTSGLVCSLPASPSVGDVINLATGNYSFRVNHGNGNQIVLNSSTQSTVGTDSGIILKNYSAIQLIYMGANLWVSGYRARSINNWIPDSLEPTASQKSYTATGLEAYSYYGDYTPSRLNDGDLAGGVMKSDGGTANQLRILFTFAQPVNLTSFNYWLGQFNGAFNYPSSCDVYIGNAVNAANLIDSFTFPALSGTRNISNTQNSSTYVINFKGSGGISVSEIQLIGKGIIGGEIPV